MFLPRLFFLLGCLSFIPLATSCSSQVEAEKSVSYKYAPGRTAVLKNGIAYAPRNAPLAVKKAIAAGNRLQEKPYKFGGGHARHNDTGYDCSGTVSYVLREAGLMQGSMPSRGFLNYGKKGSGKWITIYVRPGHVFMTVAGLRIDTGGPRRESGPRWRPETRSGRGHVLRHPPGY